MPDSPELSRDSKSSLPMSGLTVPAAPQKLDSSVEVLSETFSTTSIQYSGPIPPAEELSNYEKICPGAADRLIKIAESEQTHRHKMESGMLELENRKLNTDMENDRAIRTEIRIGQIFGFMLASIVIIAGAVIALHAKSWQGETAGSLLSISGIVALINAFVFKHKVDTTKEIPPRGPNVTLMPSPDIRNVHIPP